MNYQVAESIIRKLTDCAIFTARGTRIEWDAQGDNVRANVRSREGNFYVEYNGGEFVSDHPVANAWFKTH